MVLLGALYLALNATNSSVADDTAVSGSVVRPTLENKDRYCDFRSKAFDADACHKYVLNATSTELRTRIEGASRGAGNWKSYVSSGASCNGTFYAFTTNEFELLYPQLKLQQCYISTYGAFMHSIALMHPCRTNNMSAAKFVMLPPFLANDCNWPGYGGVYCFANPNVFRRGHLCLQEMRQAIAHFAQDHRGTTTLILDQKSTGKVYDLPTNMYKVGNRIFAKVNTHRFFYRPGVDVSMPPPPFPVVMETPEQSWRASLESKRYFVSFKGQMRTRIRRLVKKMHHTGQDCVIADRDEDEYDFQHLLYNTRFNLILPGDMEFSYRFNEAVCSGGIPVMLSENWIPPFNETIPFETYGFFFKENKAPILLKLLRAEPLPKLEEMRKVTRRACNEYFRTPATQVAALIRNVLNRNAPGTHSADGGHQNKR